MTSINKSLVDLLLEELETELEKFSKQTILEDSTQLCWKNLGQEKHEDEDYRKFITCHPWIYFIAISNNINGVDNFIRSGYYLTITDKTWLFLERFLDPQQYCAELVKPFIYDLKRLLTEFKEYLNLKATKQNPDKPRPEKNYLVDLAFLSPELRLKIFQCLTYANDTKTRNIEIEPKYSASQDTIIHRSLLLADKLKEQLQDLLNLNDFIEKEIGFLSIDAFHQPLYDVFLLFYKNNGIIRLHELDGILSTVEDMYAVEGNRRIINRDDVIKLLNLLSSSYEEINTAYHQFKINIKNKNTLLTKENPFFDKPIFKYEDNEDFLYICPSPYIFFVNIGRLFSLLFYKHIQKLNNVREIEVRNGKAYEAYINDILRHYDEKVGFQFYNLDDEKKKIKDGSGSNILQKIKDEKGDQIPCADFIIETDNYILIVECKNSIGLRDPFYKSPSQPDEPHPLLSSWNRMHGSFSGMVQNG